ncbi:MAG: LysM domain-containing protein [Alicyclobacillus sp.]|nr:LysM domain-containing protein [Alicyclobacillus sp.]
MVKYVVQRGDTLGTIAARFGTTVEAIVRVNGIRNPDMIYKGQILRIPSEYYDNGSYYHNPYHKHYKHHHND